MEGVDAAEGLVREAVERGGERVEECCRRLKKQGGRETVFVVAGFLISIPSLRSVLIATPFEKTFENLS